MSFEERYGFWKVVLLLIAGKELVEIVNKNLKTIRKMISLVIALVLTLTFLPASFFPGDLSTSQVALGSVTSFGGPKLMPWARMDEPFMFGVEYWLYTSWDPQIRGSNAVNLPYVNPVTGNVEPCQTMLDYANLVAGQNSSGQPVIAADVQLHQLVETIESDWGRATKDALDRRLQGDTHTFSDVVDADGRIIDYDCPRIVVVPSVVNPMGTPNMHSDDTLIWPTGMSSLVEVERFNYFFISRYDDHYVTGIFIETLTSTTPPPGPGPGPGPAVDTTPPVIANIKPIDGEKIVREIDFPWPIGEMEPVTVSATYYDPGSGIDESSVRIYIDDKDVTDYTQVAYSGMVFEHQWFRSAHTARLVVKDRTGNAAEKQWSFSVYTALIDTQHPWWIAEWLIKEAVGRLRWIIDVIGRWIRPTPVF